MATWEHVGSDTAKGLPSSLILLQAKKQSETSEPAKLSRKENQAKKMDGGAKRVTVRKKNKNASFHASLA